MRSVACLLFLIFGGGPSPPPTGVVSSGSPPVMPNVGSEKSPPCVVKDEDEDADWADPNGAGSPVFVVVSRPPPVVTDAELVARPEGTLAFVDEEDTDGVVVDASDGGFVATPGDEPIAVFIFDPENVFWFGVHVVIGSGDIPIRGPISMSGTRGHAHIYNSQRSKPKWMKIVYPTPEPQTVIMFGIVSRRIPL